MQSSHVRKNPRGTRSERGEGGGGEGRGVSGSAREAFVYASVVLSDVSRAQELRHEIRTELICRNPKPRNLRIGGGCLRIFEVPTCRSNDVKLTLAGALPFPQSLRELDPSKLTAPFALYFRQSKADLDRPS